MYGHRVGTGAGSYAQDIVVISPREAKGLEFDGVVVLEPTDMLNHEHGRVGDLYVAMTRPTQRLRLIAASGRPGRHRGVGPVRPVSLPGGQWPGRSGRGVRPGRGVTCDAGPLILLT